MKRAGNNCYYGLAKILGIIWGVERAIIYHVDPSGNPVWSGNMAAKKIRRESVFNTENENVRSN